MEAVNIYAVHDAAASQPRPSSEVLALSDVGRTHPRAAGMPAFAVPATLAVPLSRGGLFYPLASLDISGQWPVFEQEPHLNGWSSLSCCQRARQGRSAIVGLAPEAGKSPRRGA